MRLERIYKNLDDYYQQMHHDDPGIDEVFDALQSLEEAIGAIKAFDPEDSLRKVHEREQEHFNDAKAGR